MNLFLISLDYPFGVGETFVEDELFIAKDYFENINIISLSGHVDYNKMRKIPDNAKVIVARQNRYELSLVIYSIIGLFSFTCIQEMIFSKRNFKASYQEIFFNLFIYNYYCLLLTRAFRDFEIKDDDVVYSYWMAAPAYFLAKTKKIVCKKICRTHRFDCFINYSYQPYRRQILEKLDDIYSISDAGKKDIELNIINKFNVNVNGVKVSRLGVIKNSNIMNPDENESDFFKVVTCSNINRVKRLDLMIKALSCIDIKIHWTHIGDGELENEIRKMTEELKHKDNIKISFLGRKNKAYILEYYATNHVDLFVNCSDSEGIPVSIMEAMSYGIPVIARDVGGNSEIVNNKNGFLLDGRDSVANIVLAIKTYAKMTENDVKKMRKSAFEMYDKNYNAKINYDSFFNDITMKE